MPENYSHNQKYPLLIFLHGAGERGDDNELQLFHGSNLFLDKNFVKNTPAIIVFPQCPKGSYWATIIDRPEPLKFQYSKSPKNNPILSLVEGIIDDFIEKYKVDKQRIYIGGLSMGGMGTFEMVYRNPRTFAAAFAIWWCKSKNFKKNSAYFMRIDHGDRDNVATNTFRAYV